MNLNKKNVLKLKNWMKLEIKTKTCLVKMNYFTDNLIKKQSKQAKRYKNIQKDITRARATVFYQKWQMEKNKVEETTQKFDKQNNSVADQTQRVASMNVEY